MKIKLTVRLLHEMICGDSEDFDMIEQNTTGHWRHGTEETGVFQRIADGKFFRFNWRDSCKDSCEFVYMNDSSNAEGTEVFPKEVVTIIYE
jgi:hypothetical protein